MDRFIKYSKFISANEFYLIEDFADIVVREVINNYRLLDKFVTNRNIIFASRFFITFIVMFEMNNKLFIVFYL